MFQLRRGQYYIVKHFFQQDHLSRAHWIVSGDVDGKAVSSSHLFYNPVNDRYGMGIYTLSNYQNRGYGTITAAAASEYCLNKGATLDWDAFSWNESSIKIANKLGHKIKRSYSSFPLTFDKFVQYTDCWWNLYSQGKFEKAISIMEKIYQNRDMENIDFLWSKEKWGEWSYALYYYRFGLTYSKLGKLNEAKGSYQTALKYLAKSSLQKENLVERSNLKEEPVIYLEKLIAKL